MVLNSDDRQIGYRKELGNTPWQQTRKQRTLIMASFDSFLGQSWHDWAAHSEIHGHTQRTDKQKDAAQELVDRETPHLTMEKDIAISQVQ